MTIGPHEADELHHLDEGTGRRLGHAQTVQHFARLEPAIGANGFLSDISEDGIGTAEGDDGGLAEENADLSEDVVRPLPESPHHKRREPEHGADGQDGEGAP
jgi:hypothetical protein